MKRYFLILGIFCILAQDSWAFAVSDTLIIDGQTVYLEEHETPFSDSLSNARKKDFREKRREITWGLNGGMGTQISDFGISRNELSGLATTSDFLDLSDKIFYHSSLFVGGYIKIHSNIEIGISAIGSKGVVSEANAEVAAGSTVSFYSNLNQIQQVVLTEVQPQVFELDTFALSVQNANFSLTSFQVPFNFRFYVNDFNFKSKWKAYGEISPVYRSFSLRNKQASTQLLFLNSDGNYEYLEVRERKWSNFGVLVGVGSEFQLTKRMNAFVQASWNFPPVNSSSESGLNYFTQYSNLFLGLRVLMNNGK